MNPENVDYPFKVRFYSPFQKKKILYVMTKRVNLDDITSETCQAQKEKYCGISLT